MKYLNHISFFPEETARNDYYISLSPGIRLRREYFGGLVYDMRNGNILEIDKDVFNLLSYLRNGRLNIGKTLRYLTEDKIIKKSGKQVGKTINKLMEFGIIRRVNDVPAPLSSPTFSENKLDQVLKPWLSAPETIHWAITYRCDVNCQDCYVRRFSFNKPEISTDGAQRLIDRIADWGVFQLAIGGGEPFLRDDLAQLVNYAADKGLSVNITTGKTEINKHQLKSMADALKILQMGMKPDYLLDSQTKFRIKQIQTLAVTCRDLGIIPGVNLFLSESVIQNLEHLVDIIMNLGFARVILLRYKPPVSIDRWQTEKPTVEQAKGVHQMIANILKNSPNLDIHVDCALSFSQRFLPKETAKKLGIKGCVAADRILAVAPDGTAYPCSQLVHPSCYAGNLLETEPQEIWDQSRTLRKYRSFRSKKAFKKSWCGVCRAKNHCGGCRVFAEDGLGGDPGCPDPLLPKLTQLGKIGRSLDLARYLESYGSISVGEYMDRYGVRQRRAIKELNASLHTVTASGKSGTKKTDTYQLARNKTILDVQNSIGYTQAGFPFASYEQVSEWINDAAMENSYPRWLKEKEEEQCGF